MDSQGSEVNPVIPDPEITTDEIPDSPHALLAQYAISADPDTGEVTISPVRVSSSHFNVLGWIQSTDCNAAIGVECIELHPVWLDSPTNSQLRITTTIRNPFQGQQLRGFDVRGIVHLFGGNGGNWFYHTIPDPSGTPNLLNLTFSDIRQGLGYPALDNADGFTTLYNYWTNGSFSPDYEGYIQGDAATSPPGTFLLNGFVRFSTAADVIDRNYFDRYSPNQFQRTREIDIYNISGSFQFGYSIDASWAQGSSPWGPGDFPIYANCAEPWNIKVIGFDDTGPGITDLVGGKTKLLSRA